MARLRDVERPHLSEAVRETVTRGVALEGVVVHEPVARFPGAALAHVDVEIQRADAVIDELVEMRLVALVAVVCSFLTDVVVAQGLLAGAGIIGRSCVDASHGGVDLESAGTVVATGWNQREQRARHAIIPSAC